MEASEEDRFRGRPAPGRQATLTVQLGVGGSLTVQLGQYEVCIGWAKPDGVSAYNASWRGSVELGYHDGRYGMERE